MYEGYFRKPLVRANHAHIWWYNMSPLTHSLPITPWCHTRLIVDPPPWCRQQQLTSLLGCLLQLFLQLAQVLLQVLTAANGKELLLVTGHLLLLPAQLSRHVALVLFTGGQLLTGQQRGDRGAVNNLKALSGILGRNINDHIHLTFTTRVWLIEILFILVLSGW